MNKVKFLQTVVLALILLNLVIIAFVFAPRLMRPGGSGGGGVEKHFDFDQEQMAEFEKSRIEIREQLHVLRPELEKVSKEYYMSKQGSDHLLSEINLINQKIYEVHYKHFRDIVAICNEDQVQKIDVFIDDLMRGKPRGRKR